MAFPTGLLNDPKQVGAGEILGDNNVILSSPAFEDQLKVGRFAKIDSDSLDNMDASVSPVIAGVVLRKASSAVEDGDVIDAEYRSYAEYARAGLVTVKAVTGQSPAKFAAIFAHNVAGADAGKATLTDDANTEATNAEFIEVVDAANDIWLVRLK